MAQPRLLLLLLLLGATSSSRALGLSSILGCLHAALPEPRGIRPQGIGIRPQGIGIHPQGIGIPFPQENAILDKRSSSMEEDEEEEELGKRTFPGDGRSKGTSQGKGRSQQDRRTKVTLSLDVPTNIMNILFNIAKAKNLRAKAAANAHLMAQIGRRK